MTQKLTGIIPAAGKATRLGPLPCSKEILPVGFIEQTGKYPDLQLLTGLDHSLIAFSEAGIKSVHIVISPEKLDIPNYLSNRELHDNMDLQFSTVRNSPNILVSLATPFKHYQKHDVALLFPDIIFEPRNLLQSLWEVFSAKQPDIVLGLFPTKRGDKMDIVSFSPDGQVKSVLPKPGPEIEGHTWIAAIWNPRFSILLDQEAKNSHARPHDATEIFIGDVVQTAILKGFSVIGVPFTDGWCIDLGTTSDLRKYWQTRC
ncbi:MAG: nucleotidyl transferase [Woeseia sp.]|nr:nucleotidyl transferase [Woeseia sp.]|tara:strand:- start:1116 stop:1892 length:777 start_codon:yes stop_codon:yes gene_type:complete